jgi:hypothetical protein
MKRKITSYYLLIVIASSLLVSCSNDEEVKPVLNQSSKLPEIENVIPEKTSLKELGFNTFEEFLASGITEEKIDETKKILKNKEVKNISPTGKVVKSNATNEGPQGAETIREKMNASHVEQLALGNSKIRSIYAMGGRIPGVTINAWKSSGAFGKFNLADEYGWYAYVQTGKAQISMKYLDADDGYEITKFTVYNYGDMVDNAWRSFTYTTSTTATWSASITSGVTVKGSVGVPEVASVGVEVKVEATVGVSESKTVSKSHEYRYVAQLPPRTQRTIYLCQKKRKSKVGYKIPVMITGNVALNFDKKVYGHYFWSSPASLLHQGKSEAQLGSIDYKTVYDIQIYGDRPKPITGPIPIETNVMK